MLPGTQGNVPGLVLKGYERTHYMSRRNISPQAVRICGLTLLCLVIMFGVAAANRARGGEKLVSEYTVQDEALPRHVKFESMPADMPQMTAAWFYKYKGLGQFDMCRRLFPQNQLDALNFDQEDRDFKDGYYIQEYIVHKFKTLPQEEYEEQKAHYDQLAASYGYKEYKVVRVSFSQKWSPKALEKASQWGDGEFTRVFAVGREAGLRERWKIFELGMM